MNRVEGMMAHRRHQRPARTRAALMISLTVLIIVAGAKASSAQGPAIPFKPKLYVGGGYAPIISPDEGFNDVFAPSYSFQAAVGIPLSPGLEVVGKFQYHNFSLDLEGIPAFSTIQPAVLNSLGLTDPGRTITMLGIDLKLPFGPTLLPIRPYFLMGGGSFTMKQDDVNQIISFGNPPQTIEFTPRRINETDIYFNLGFGADIKIGPTLGLFIEGKYAILNTPVESSGLTPIFVGLRLF